MSKMSFPDVQMMYHQASQARRVAEDMNRLNNVNLVGVTDNVAAVWRGDAANAFLQHCATTRDVIRNTVGELQNIASELERTAREWEAIIEEMLAKQQEINYMGGN
jgi:uncharacterized protein YukE